MRAKTPELLARGADDSHYVISAWCRSFAKRAFDVILASMMTLLVLPLVPLIAMAVRLSSQGPVFFRQRRLGLDGTEFELVKFRTMVHNSQTRFGVTSSGDHRVTRLGKFLRKTKLDELPQLWCVLAGKMSLVGPRPDLPECFSLLDEEHRQVLRLRPGLTGRASVCFRNEEEMLSAVARDELESFYISNVLPRKIRLELEYAQTASLWRDLVVLFQTFFRLFSTEVYHSAQPNQNHSANVLS